MTASSQLPIDRFQSTLEIVAREGQHLRYSWNRLFTQPIDSDWVKELEGKPEIAERLEAFISRFGRMQDTIADKLLPRWLRAMAEIPGSQIETLNRAERLGVVDSVEQWLEARQLRNRLVHEYMEDEAAFTDDLLLAKKYTIMLLETYNRIREFSTTRMNLTESSLPRQLSSPM